MKFYIVLGIFFITAFGCKDKSEPIVQEDISLQKSKPEKLIISPALQLPNLSKKAKETLENWPMYDQFKEEVFSLNKYQGLYLESSSERLNSIMDTLTKAVPERINSQVILARLLVLNTQVKLLSQQATSSKKEQAKLIEAIKNLNLAFKNFEIIVEEKFLKEQIEKGIKTDTTGPDPEK